MRQVIRWVVPVLLFLGLLLAATAVGASSVGGTFSDTFLAYEVLSTNPRHNCAIIGWNSDVPMPSMLVQGTVLNPMDGFNAYEIIEIADGAFQGDSVLTTVNFNNASYLVHIGDSAFAGSSLSGSLSLNVLPYLETIGDSAFAGCNLSGSLDIINSNALTAIGDSAFANNNFSSLSLQGTPRLTTIGDNAFANNNFSGSLFLDQLSGLQTIGNNAFAGNPGITRVIFPHAALTLGSTLFADSAGLNQLHFSATTPPACAADSFSGVAAVGTITYQKLHSAAMSAAQIVMKTGRSPG